MMILLHRYIEGWKSHDIEAVLATLADRCTIIECYGPIYRGRQRVEQWMHAWFGAGGSVDAWLVTSFSEADGVQVAEWTFTCTWKGKQNTFEGSTIARIEADEIVYLREYATTAPLYEWTGTWRT